MSGEKLQIIALRLAEESLKHWARLLDVVAEGDPGMHHLAATMIGLVRQTQIQLEQRQSA